MHQHTADGHMVHVVDLDFQIEHGLWARSGPDRQGARRGTVCLFEVEWGRIDLPEPSNSLPRLRIAGPGRKLRGYPAASTVRLIPVPPQLLEF